MSLTYETEAGVQMEASEIKQPQRPILVVEDSDDIRALLVELLEDEGYEVVVASDGENGIIQAQAHNPHLILMDLSLPGLDGWEAVRRLRQMPDFSRTPIVALTAHATKRDEERALEAGCTGYISKPFDMDNLLQNLTTFAKTN